MEVKFEETHVRRKESRTGRYFKRFRRMRRIEELCDVRVTSGNKSVTAHRVILAVASPYFDLMFSKHAGENDEINEIDLTLNVDPDALETAIDFIYGEAILITNENVKALYSAAAYLGIKDLVERCCDPYEKSLNFETVEDVRKFAEDNGFTSLVEKCDKYIKENIPFIYSHREEPILRLPLSVLCGIKSKYSEGTVSAGLTYEEVKASPAKRVHRRSQVTPTHKRKSLLEKKVVHGRSLPQKLLPESELCRTSVIGTFGYDMSCKTGPRYRRLRTSRQVGQGNEESDRFPKSTVYVICFSYSEGLGVRKYDSSGESWVTCATDVPAAVFEPHFTDHYKYCCSRGQRTYRTADSPDFELSYREEADLIYQSQISRTLKIADQHDFVKFKHGLSDFSFQSEGRRLDEMNAKGLLATAHGSKPIGSYSSQSEGRRLDEINPKIFHGIAQCSEPTSSYSSQSEGRSLDEIKPKSPHAIGRGSTPTSSSKSKFEVIDYYPSSGRRRMTEKIEGEIHERIERKFRSGSDLSYYSGVTESPLKRKKVHMKRRSYPPAKFGTCGFMYESDPSDFSPLFARRQQSGSMKCVATESCICVFGCCWYFMFNLISKTWTTRKPLNIPPSLSDSEMCVHCNEIYGISRNNIFSFDPEKNNLTIKGVLRKFVFQASIVSLGKYVYTAGGYEANNHVTNSFGRWCPEKYKSEKLPGMLKRRALHGCAALNGKIYVTGGQDPWHQPMCSAEVFDTISNTWNVISSMMDPRSGFSLVSWNGKLLAVGQGGRRRTHTVEDYDPITNEWKFTAPMFSEAGIDVEIAAVSIPSEI